MELGLAEHNANTTSRAAHSLKGSASNLGANRLATVCASVEQNAQNADWAQVGVQLQELKTQLERVRESLKAEVQTA
jgi:HPt (histidine-containing phosphotransfer) domain-containing protein